MRRAASSGTKSRRSEGGETPERVLDEKSDEIVENVRSVRKADLEMKEQLRHPSDKCLNSGSFVWLVFGSPD